MTTLNLELTKKIQETIVKLRGNLEDKSWEIEEGLETEESWAERQSMLVSKINELLAEATKEDLVAITSKTVFDGQYSEKSLYLY